MSKENIIFCVPRTSVLTSFIDPLYLFLNRKFNLYIFHIDSLYHSTSAEREYEKIDIGKMSLKKIIQRINSINPVVLFCLHFASLNEKLMIRIGKKLNIKIFYLQHGLLLPDQLFYVKNFAAFRINFWASLYRNYYFIRNSLYYIFFLSFNVKEFSIFYNMIFKNIFIEGCCDKAFFFTNDSFEMMNKYFHFKSNQVKISGFPLCNSNEELVKYNENKHNSKGKYIVYVHAPFVQTRGTHLTYKQEREYLMNYFNFFINEGFIIKLLVHPRENILLYTDLYKEMTNIEVIQVQNSLSLLSDAKFVIGHSSTILLNALLLKIPVIQIPYPSKFENAQIFEEYFLKIDNLFDLQQSFREKGKIEDFISKIKSNNDLPIKPTSFEHLADLLIEII